MTLVPISIAVSKSHSKNIPLQGIEQQEFSKETPFVLGEAEVQIGADIVDTILWQFGKHLAKTSQTEIFAVFDGEEEEDAGGVVEFAFAVVAGQDEFRVVEQLSKGRSTMWTSSSTE